ncbi:spore germination protein [Paenibacillus sp. R14(2021)]|uniref:spore germination protein n=1 Tax=Paenibacillus sp. R14(2021) TaxID=2859228 RepID=UPI002158362A|nr:spore germination protein [Paenibacillus sp. R14(2021)]
MDPGTQIVADIAKRFGHSCDFICRSLPLHADNTIYCLFISSITTSTTIDEMILKPLIESSSRQHTGEINADWLTGIIPLVNRTLVSDAAEGIKELLSGNCLLITPKQAAFLSFDVAKQDYRSITEPKSESAIRGPRDGFVENVQLNMALIRKRLKSPDLMFETFTIGSQTSTVVQLAYLRNIANDSIVAEFRERLTAIQTDSILESSYIEEWIQDQTRSPFPQLISTERPDVIVAKMLEGSTAVLIDGTPMALTGPITFFQLFSSPEDYYQRADIATLLRWLRMLSFVLSIFVPSLYIAVVSYHQELLPTPLLISLAAQREEVPFPAVIEAIIMTVTFEILREAGLRMPRIAGQAISIVGALVIGQASVEAGLVSAAMVIVVSLTAISNYISPSYGFGIAQRIVQFVFMLLAGVMGLYGLMCGVFVLLVHLVSIRSFTVHYMSPLAPIVLADWKDTIVRVPRKMMTLMPKEMRTKKNTK